MLQTRQQRNTHY